MLLSFCCADCLCFCKLKPQVNETYDDNRRKKETAEEEEEREQKKLPVIIVVAHGDGSPEKGAVTKSIGEGGMRGERQR